MPQSDAWLQPHAPLARHTGWIEVQSALVQQFAIGMQALPHGFCPDGHTHTPAEHTNPAAH
jgi:hypothetical protein